MSHDFAQAMPIVGLHASERAPAKTSDQRLVSETGYTFFEIFCMAQIRIPLDRLTEMNTPLAKRLEALRAEMRSASLGLGGGYSQNEPYGYHLDDGRMDRVCRVSEVQEALVGDIRKVPGFEEFLQATAFEKLRQAAIEGPVVVVSHSRFRCDSLIIPPREDESCVCVH